MRNQPETQHAYNIRRLNWIFLWSSLLALVVTVWMIYYDWDREWKSYQKHNKQIEIEKARQDFTQAQQLAREDVERLDAQIKAQQAKLELKRREVESAEAAFQKADIALKNADTDYKFAKAESDERKSAYEIEVHEAALDVMRVKKVSIDEAVREARREEKIEHTAAEMAGLLGRVSNLDLKLQDADARQKAAKAKVEEFVGHKLELEKERGRLLGDQDKATKRIASLQTKGAKMILDAPLLESFQPTLRVEQRILDDHRFNLNFVDVPRVDRCMTCHLNMDKKVLFPTITSKAEADNKPVNPDDLEALIDKGKEKGWLDYEDVHEFAVKKLKLSKGVTATQISSILAALKDEKVEYRDFYRKLGAPYFSHPKLDLFVGTESPHPAEKFGCTSCHWGWDRDVRFVDATHTPDPEKHVKVEWEAEPTPLLASLGVKGKKESFDGNQHDYWVKRYGWHEVHDFDQRMRPAKFLESACLKCHVNVTEIPAADKLNRGLNLIKQAGCWSCHRVKQLEHNLSHKVRPGEDLDSIARLYSVDAERIKVANNLAAEPRTGQVLEVPVRQLTRNGPSLTNVAGKLDETWIRKWLANPKAFRPNAFMPRFWGLSNNDEKVHYAGTRVADIKASDRNDVEMDAIAAFVLANSAKPAFPAPPVKGDAARGKDLVEKVGCYGCHVIGEKLAEMKVEPRKVPGISEEEYRRLRSQGPMLAGVGSKVGEGWLYAWLKHPKALNPQTRMPNLRLEDQEAADIAAFLMTQKHEEFAKQSLPAVKQAVLDDVAQEYLQNSLPHKEAKAIIDAETPAEQKKIDPALVEALKGVWSDKDIQDRLGALDFNAKKRLFLGVKLTARYGCYSCHQVKGFETTKSIGTELSEWGSKATAKLDFGYLEKKIEHNNYAYVQQKVAAPRSYDKTDTRMPQEWMRMPQFDFSQEQIADIATAIMGMTDEKITTEAKRKLSAAEWDIENGRWLAVQLNCRGCHVLERKGAAIRETIEDQAYYPPDLFAQGARTQPDWLFKFLKAPLQLRPRLYYNARMPTFDLTDEQANMLVRYFNFLDSQDFPFEKDFLMRTAANPEVVAAGKELFEKLQCVKCHRLKPGQKLSPEAAAQQFPSLLLVRERLKPKWVADWMHDPNYFQKGTSMPAFWVEGGSPFPNILGGKPDKQIEAVRDYLYEYKGEDLDKPLPAEATPAAAPGAKPAGKPNQYE